MSLLNPFFRKKTERCVALLSFQLGLFNFSPFFKRLFWWSPEIYALISVMPLASLVSYRVNVFRAIWLFSFLCFSFFLLPLDRFLAYVPVSFLMLFVSRIDLSKVVDAVFRIKWLFYASVGYGLVQKYLGYMPFELAWISSGIGAVGEAGYFVTDDIRPFSFYAGVPEFGFFSAMVMYCAFVKKARLLFLVAVLGIVLAGSRGVLISAGLGCVAFVFSRTSLSGKRLVALTGLLLGFVLYVYLVILIPAGGFSMADGESRMLVAGTFNARVFMLEDLLSQINSENIWFGVHGAESVFDNFYLTLINDFGIVGIVVFVALVLSSIRSQCGCFAAIVSMSYCFYADALLSVYFAFGAFVFILSKEDSEKSGNRSFC